MKMRLWWCKYSLFAIVAYAHSIDAQKAQKTKTVVHINTIIREFDHTSSCHATQWLNSLDNACQCCLIKNYTYLFAGKKPSEIVNQCFQAATSCDLKTIHQLLKKEGITSTNPEEAYRILLDTLFQHSIVIKEVVGSQDNLFNNAGKFITAAVPVFLARAYQEKALLHPDFRKAACLQAKDLLADKGGVQTMQLFLITSTCSNSPVNYILKEASSGTQETINLEKLRTNNMLKQYIYPHIVPHFPCIILPIAYLSYRYHLGNSVTGHFLSLMPEAPGYRLADLPQLFIDKKLSAANIEHIYYHTGDAFAHFHKLFMQPPKNGNNQVVLQPTYNHGDAHQQNMFFDMNKNQLFFIDAEQVGVRFGSPAREVTYFFIHSISKLPRALVANTVFVNQWLAMTMKPFIRAYAQVFAPRQKDVIKELFQDMKLYFDKNEDSYYAPFRHESHKKTMEAIFSALNVI